MRRYLLLLTLAACTGDDEPVLPVPALTALTFNVHGADTIQDPVTGPAIADEILAAAPQIASLEECVSCEALLANLPATYALVPAEDASDRILYDADLWEVRDSGNLVLGANDDGWGQRDARWARLELRETGAAVYVYATHWCVSIRHPDDPCDVAKQIEYGRRILDHVGSHAAPSIVGGDFNVFDGFEDGAAIQSLEDGGLVDTLREITDAPVVTYQGNTSFPPGRIDYLFTTRPVDVTAAAVEADSVSDHRIVSATFSLPVP